MDTKDIVERGVSLGYYAAPDSVQAKLWSLGRAMHGSTVEETNETQQGAKKAARHTIDIPVELLARIKTLSVLKGISLQDAFQNALEKELSSEPEKWCSLMVTTFTFYGSSDSERVLESLGQL